MRHKSYRTIRRMICEMQKHSIGRAVYCAKYPQDYIAAKKIGVMNGARKSQT